MDRRHLSLAREAEPRFEQLIPAETEAVLLVEQEGDDPLGSPQPAASPGGRVVAAEAIGVWGPPGVRRRRDASCSGGWSTRCSRRCIGVKGPSRPVPIVEDMAVAPDVLPDFLVRMQNVLKRNQVTASLFCHAGHGQLHIQPFLDLANPDDVRTDAAAGRRALPGSLRRAGEHQRRTCLRTEPHGVRAPAGRPAVRRVPRSEADLRPAEHPQSGQDRRRRPGSDHALPAAAVAAAGVAGLGGERCPAVGAARRGCAAAAGDGCRHRTGRRSRRCGTSSSCNWTGSRRGSAMRWRRATVAGSAARRRPSLRMCPLFRIAPSEEASPRAKANLIRGVSDRHARPRPVDQRRVQDDCRPVRPLPRLPAGMSGRRGHSAADAREQRGLRGRQRPAAGRLGHDPARPAGGARQPDRAGGQLGDRQPADAVVAGEDVGDCPGAEAAPRGLAEFLAPRGPPPAHPALRAAAARRCSTSSTCTPTTSTRNWPKPWSPCWNTTASPSMCHPGPEAGGHALDRLRRRWNTPGSWPHTTWRLLAESVRQGYHVVATEPAAALCLIHEYPQLLDDDDARLVAANSSEACTYLWNMHTRGQLQLDFRPLNVVLGYHTPCHLRALQVGSPGEQLLGLIPGLQLRQRGSGLFRHGRHVRTAAQELPQQSPRRLETDLAAPRSAPCKPASPSAARARCRWSRARPSPPSTPSSCWRCLRPDAGNGPAAGCALNADRRGG